jgi:hypothetical protein
MMRFVSRLNPENEEMVLPVVEELQIFLTVDLMAVMAVREELWFLERIKMKILSWNSNTKSISRQMLVKMGGPKTNMEQMQRI